MSDPKFGITFIRPRDYYALRAELARVTQERDALTDRLHRSGFVPCDIPACNCGDWHHRYGLPERMAEIKDELAEAGYPLCNENGNLALNALRGLIAALEKRQAAIDELVSAKDAFLSTGFQPDREVYTASVRLGAAHAALTALATPANQPKEETK